MNHEEVMIDKWRKLGFFYDLDDRLTVNQWRIYGSRGGLRKLITLIEEYIANNEHHVLSAQMLLGPYADFKIVTSEQATIRRTHFAGTIQDLNFLKNLIASRLSTAKPGQTFNIDKDYGIENTVTVKFFVMDDEFDPYTMDELIVSGRQMIVNKNMKRPRR